VNRYPANLKTWILCTRNRTRPDRYIQCVEAIGYMLQAREAVGSPAGKKNMLALNTSTDLSCIHLGMSPPALSIRLRTVSAVSVW
jgi:hypothetical protein